MRDKLTAALIAEFVGTFALIFVGAGAAALGVGGLVGVALAHGLVVMAFVYAYGDLSGTHINPAVTVGLWGAKAIPTGRAAAYVAVQLAGGIAGALVLRFCLAGRGTNLGATVLADGVTPVQGLVLEALFAFFLVNTVLHAAVAGKAGNLAGVAIGLTLTFCILMGGPLTGASVNPARTLGPAVAAGIYGHLWVYLVGTVLGALAAAGLYRTALRSG